MDEIKLKRRVSPNGMVTLPRPARLKLGFVKGKGHDLIIEVGPQAVHVGAAEKGAPRAVKVSPRGLCQLPRDVHVFLNGGKKGHIELSVSDHGVRFGR